MRSLLSEIMDGGEDVRGDASLAARARLQATRHGLLTPSEHRTKRRIRARWRLAEWKRRRSRMRLIA